jgi:uncharacterized protein (TIGR00369 family)
MTPDASLQASKTISWFDPRPTAALGRESTGLEFMSRMVAGEVPPAPIMSHFNMTLVSVDKGDAVFEAIPDDSLYNPIGVIHGGFALTLLDSAAGCAVHTTLALGQAYTSLETKVNFLRAVTSDTGPLRAHGWVTKPGSRAAFAEADLRTLDGTLLATAQSTCLVFPLG